MLASIVAAETSAGTFFGTPGEGFALRNYTYVQLALGTILARILVSYIFIKPYYDYKVFSIYEYLTARFGVPTKNAASAIFMITRLLASGARLYVAAIALALAYEMIRGVRPGQTETLWIYIGATVVIVILTAIYTTLGGIKAVIWTDLIQASIMIGSALIALRCFIRRFPVAGMRSCNATAVSVFAILSPPASIRPNTAGTKSKACLKSSTPFSPA